MTPVMGMGVFRWLNELIKMIYTITLNPSVDQHITIPKLVKDDAIRALSSQQYPGGKGINVSRGLSLLGCGTKVFTVRGGCSGYILRDLLEKSEIGCAFVEVLGETRINVILTDLSDRSQTRVSLPGPEVGSTAMKAMMEKIAVADPRPHFWVLGGSLPPSSPPGTYANIIGYLKSKGEKCVLDADGDALEEGVKAKPFMIKPNEFELERLTGRKLKDDNQVFQAAAQLCHDGVEIVAVTLGARGALVATRKECYRLEAPIVEVKSKVGAGDSFIAGFLVATVSGKSIQEAFVDAVAAGTAAVIHEGTQLYAREDFEKIKPLVKVKVLKDLSQSQARDPVCGMEIDKLKSSDSIIYMGKEYFFCSMACKDKFTTHPGKYSRNEKP